MPIVINSRSCSNAGWWANHLKKAETNERVEIVGFYGLSAETIEDALDEMRGMAQGSKAKNFFSQYNINPRADEHLTEAQWDEAHALHRKNHGLDHLPYFRVRHIKEGRVHEHGIALRVDPETSRAIPDSLTAPINERTSRALEIRFDLERGISVLTANREQERPERRPTKRETFREGERKADIEAVQADARAARAQADNGQSFRAALEQSGAYVLAAGDRRDFVIIDRDGETHSLARRLGMKAAEVRAYMADLDRTQLPTVEQAKERQAELMAARTAQEPRRQPQQAGMEKHGAGVSAATAPLNAAQKAPQPTPQKASRELGKAAGEIRLAWKLTQDAAQFAQRIEDRGLILVYVTAEQAQASERAAAFAKAVERRSRAMREGFAVVDQRGSVTRIDQRVTGDQWEEIQKRLGGIDRAELLTVAQARDVMREASRTAWIEQQHAEREKARPATALEQKIIDAGRTAQGDPQKLAELLEKDGIALVRVTAADMRALEALRADEQHAQLVAADRGEAHRAAIFGKVREGELAAVTKHGDVFRLNQHHLAAIDRRSAEPRPNSLAVEGQAFAAALPGVTEVRALFENNTAVRDAFWTAIKDGAAKDRAGFQAAHAERMEKAAGEQELRGVVHAVQQTFEAPAAAVGKAARKTGKLARVAEKIFETAFGLLFGGFMAGPKDTPAQAEQKEKAASNIDTIHAEAVAAAEQQTEFAREWRAHDLKTSQQEKSLRLAQTLGTNATEEATHNRDPHERERERKQGYEREL